MDCEFTIHRALTVDIEAKIWIQLGADRAGDWFLEPDLVVFAVMVPEDYLGTGVCVSSLDVERPSTIFADKNEVFAFDSHLDVC